MFQLAFYIFIIMGAILHEYSHGFMADKLGDPTARFEGRLTFNPLKHIDLFGTIILPLILILTTGIAFGYAKPVPYNPYNLKNPKRDAALVGAAGPLSNLLVAGLLGLVMRFLPFNTFTYVLGIGLLVNIILAVFNLVPIPPLDGSKVLLAFIPDSWATYWENLERWGIFLVFIFIYYFFSLLMPIISFVFLLFSGRPLLM